MTSVNLKYKPLGAYLIEAGIVNSVQIDLALNEQKLSQRRLGEILSAWGWVEQQTIEYLIEKIVLPEQQAEKKKLDDSEINLYHNFSEFGQESFAIVPDANAISLLNLNTPSRELEFFVSARKAARFLLTVVTVLVLLSLIGQFNHYFLPDYPLRELFAELTNVDEEENFPTLYSASALLISSALLAIIAYAKKLAGERYVQHWGALSIIFLILSLDEFLGLHEKVIEPLRHTLKAGGLFYYTWVIPGAIFVLVCLLSFMRFLAALPVKTRRLILIAGTVYIGGALGVEMLDGYYAQMYSNDSMMYSTLTTIEEFMEMLGIVIFIYALLSYISSFMKGVSLQINIIDDRKKLYSN